MIRLKLLIEYDGSCYVGWQKQKNGKSIQGEIEKCLKVLCKSNVRLFVAGRTDAGVHALGQVAHFDIYPNNFEIKKICFALNNLLKKNNNTITILNCTKVSDKFHARFSAIKKTYNYKIYNREFKSYIWENKVWSVNKKLCLVRMRTSSKFLIGFHNFNAFRSSNCQAANPERSIDEIRISKNSDIINIRITARSFLHNQVRIIVGTICNIGEGKWDINKMKEILDSKNRNLAGITAPPSGLYLEKIYY